MMVAHVTEVCISMQKLPIDNVTMHALYSDDVQAAQTERGNITTDTGYQQEITHQITDSHPNHHGTTCLPGSLLHRLTGYMCLHMPLPLTSAVNGVGAHESTFTLCVLGGFIS